MQVLSKHQLLASLALTLAMVACRSHDGDSPVNPTPVDPRFDTSGVTMDASTGATNLHQLDTAQFTASGAGITDPAAVVWYVDGDSVGTGVSLTFTQRLPGDYEVILRQGAKGLARKVSVRPRFSKGMLLLNEGNLGNETGTLTYINAKHGLVIDSAYQRVNPGHKLGNVCQDLTFANGKIYIISQNGAKNGGEGLLTIAKEGSLERLHVLNDPTLEPLNPSHIAVIGERIYLRTDRGIYVGTETGGFELISGTLQAKKLRMVTLGERVYALSGTSDILVLQGKQVVGTYHLPVGQLVAMTASQDGNLWIAYAEPNPANQNKNKSNNLAKLSADPRELKILDTHAIDINLTAGWGAAPILWAQGDKLYFPEAVAGSWGPSLGTNIYVHDFASSSTQLAFNFKTLAADGYFDTYYNSLGVDDAGHIYFAGLKGFGNLYKENRIAVTGGKLTKPVTRDGANAFPAGFYPIPHKKKG